MVKWLKNWWKDKWKGPLFRVGRKNVVYKITINVNSYVFNLIGQILCQKNKVLCSRAKQRV